MIFTRELVLPLVDIARVTIAACFSGDFSMTNGSEIVAKLDCEFRSVFFELLQSRKPATLSREIRFSERLQF